MLYPVELPFRGRIRTANPSIRRSKAYLRHFPLYFPPPLRLRHKSKEQQAIRDGGRFRDSNPQHSLSHTAHPLKCWRSNPFLRHPYSPALQEVRGLLMASIAEPPFSKAANTSKILSLQPATRHTSLCNSCNGACP